MDLGVTGVQFCILRAKSDARKLRWGVSAVMALTCSACEPSSGASWESAPDAAIDEDSPWSIPSGCSPGPNDIGMVPSDSCGVFVHERDMFSSTSKEGSKVNPYAKVGDALRPSTNTTIYICNSPLRGISIPQGRAITLVGGFECGTWKYTGERTLVRPQPGRGASASPLSVPGAADKPVRIRNLQLETSAHALPSEVAAARVFGSSNVVFENVGFFALPGLDASPGAPGRPASTFRGDGLDANGDVGGGELDCQCDPMRPRGVRSCGGRGGNGQMGDRAATDGATACVQGPQARDWPPQSVAECAASGARGPDGRDARIPLDGAGAQAHGGGSGRSTSGGRGQQGFDGLAGGGGAGGANGGGGGGGACGGCGGEAGYPGEAGGSSIAVKVSYSSVSFRNCELRAGRAGNGGDGGRGADGTPGGRGGAPSPNGGCAGGNGGNGARGAHAGGGAGGVAAGVMLVEDAKADVDDATWANTSYGEPGRGGKGGAGSGGPSSNGIDGVSGALVRLTRADIAVRER